MNKKKYSDEKKVFYQTVEIIYSILVGYLCINIRIEWGKVDVKNGMFRVGIDLLTSRLVGHFMNEVLSIQCRIVVNTK